MKICSIWISKEAFLRIVFFFVALLGVTVVLPQRSIAQDIFQSSENDFFKPGIYFEWTEQKPGCVPSYPLALECWVPDTDTVAIWLDAGKPMLAASAGVEGREGRPITVFDMSSEFPNSNEKFAIIEISVPKRAKQQYFVVRGMGRIAHTEWEYRFWPLTCQKGGWDNVDLQFGTPQGCRFSNDAVRRTVARALAAQFRSGAAPRAVRQLVTVADVTLVEWREAFPVPSVSEAPSRSAMAREVSAEVGSANKGQITDGGATATLDGVRFDGRPVVYDDPAQNARTAEYLRTALYPRGWPRYNEGWRLRPIDNDFPDRVEYYTIVSLRYPVRSYSEVRNTVSLEFRCRPGRGASILLPLGDIDAEYSGANSRDTIDITLGKTKWSATIATGESNGTTDVITYTEQPNGQRRDERTLFSLPASRPIFFHHLYFRPNAAEVEPGDVTLAEALAAGSVRWDIGALSLPLNLRNVVWRRMLTSCR